jgi:hypothetical protein
MIKVLERWDLAFVPGRHHASQRPDDLIDPRFEEEGD